MRHALFAYLIVGIAAAAYIVVSASSLPPVVASHFDASGAPNGFMAREAYLVFMLCLTLGLPLLLLLPRMLLGLVPVRFINLPNRDYWLSQERSGETIRFLRNHSLWLSALVLLLLCFVHRVVVDANAVQPPHLQASSLVIGLAAFIVGMAVWLVALIVRFRKRV